MQYYVYAIKSLRSKEIYIGISSDPTKRLKSHNKGDSKFTKAHRPWKLIHQELAGNRREARTKEKQLKGSYNQRKFLYQIPG